MLWSVVAYAEEAAITLSRAKEDIEKQEPYVVTSDMNDVKASDTYEREFYRRRSVARLAAMDQTFRWELPAVEACAARTPATGDVEARFTLVDDGTVKRVVAKGEPALVACVRETFTDVRLPLTRTENVAYTLHFSPAARRSPAPTAIDRDLGLNGVPFGASVESVEGLEAKGNEGDTTFYQRDTDFTVSWMGIPAAGISYGFDDDGFFVAIVRATGDDAKFKLRQALRDRYGQGRIDPVSQSEYWRGQTNLLEARDAGEALLVTFLDIERARASGLLTRMPGDTASQKAREVPRYLRKAVQTPPAEPPPPAEAAPPAEASPPAEPTPPPTP